MKKKTWILPILLLLTACTTITKSGEWQKSYSVGEETFALVGQTLLKEAYLEYKNVRQYAGLGTPGGPWKESKYISDHSFEIELVYSGCSGDIIYLTYREFRHGLARQAFYQNLVYDLSKSKTIAFKNYLIEVLVADNTRIRFIVISD